MEITCPFRWAHASTTSKNLPFTLRRLRHSVSQQKGSIAKKMHNNITEHKKLFSCLSGLRDKFYCRLLIGLWSREVELIHLSVGRVVSVVLLFLCLNQIASDGNIPAAIKTRQHSRLSQSPAIVQWVALNISCLWYFHSKQQVSVSTYLYQRRRAGWLFMTLTRWEYAHLCINFMKLCFKTPLIDSDQDRPVKIISDVTFKIST